MDLIYENDSVRIYQDEQGKQQGIARTTAVFYFMVERSLYESRDPADISRVDDCYKILRAQLAAFFAENEDFEPIGTPGRSVGQDVFLVEPEPGLRVPGVVLFMEQAYWPAPTSS